MSEIIPVSQTGNPITNVLNVNESGKQSSSSQQVQSPNVLTGSYGDINTPKGQYYEQLRRQTGTVDYAKLNAIEQSGDKPIDINNLPSNPITASDKGPVPVAQPVTSVKNEGNLYKVENGVSVPKSGYSLIAYPQTSMGNGNVSFAGQNAMYNAQTGKVQEIVRNDLVFTASPIVSTPILGNESKTSSSSNNQNNIATVAANSLFGAVGNAQEQNIPSTTVGEVSAGQAFINSILAKRNHITTPADVVSSVSDAEKQSRYNVRVEELISSGQAAKAYAGLSDTQKQVLVVQSFGGLYSSLIKPNQGGTNAPYIQSEAEKNIGIRTYAEQNAFKEVYPEKSKEYS